MPKVDERTEITFARELAWRVARLQDKGISRSEIATQAELSRGAITQILDNPQSQPGYGTVINLVHVINNLGVQWNPDEALAAAGMAPQPAHRTFFQAEAMGIAKLPVPIFDAKNAHTRGIGFASRIGEVQISGSHIFMRFNDETDFLLVETIGEADDGDLMVVDGRESFVVMPMVTAQRQGATILGKVIGRFRLGVEQFVAGELAAAS